MRGLLLSVNGSGGRRRVELKFIVSRFAILVLLLASQGYLLLRIRRAVDVSGFSPPARRRATVASSLCFALFGSVNLVVLLHPFAWVDPPRLAQVGLLYPMAVWNVGAIFSALTIWVVRISHAVAPRLAALVPRLAHPLPVDPGRRRLLKAAAGGVAAAPMVLSGFGAAYASNAYEVEEVELAFGCTLRVVQLSDIHAGLYMTRREMRRYAERVSRLEPDLFVLTGDFVSNSLSYLPGCLAEMERVQARYGTFATLGNHEHYAGKMPDILAAFDRTRVRLLQNGHQVIDTGCGRFAVAGIDDLRTGLPDLGAALDGLGAALPTILLSHHPEVFPEAARQGVPLTLAGHWHGGQVKMSLPGLDLSIAHLMSPYPEGLYRIGASRLYVSRGIGTTGAPIRLNAPPEITLFRLT
jgi:predicted MPP superfamily phosphohydrolase